MIFLYVKWLQPEAYNPMLLVQQFLRQNEIYIDINIAFLLIINKPQPNLHSRYTCLGLGDVPQTDCSVANPGKRHGGPGGPGGPAPRPFIFRPNWGPKGWKNFLIPLLPAYLRVWMTAPPPPPPPPPRSPGGGDPPPPPPPYLKVLDLLLWFPCNKQSSIAITSNTP